MTGCNRLEGPFNQWVAGSSPARLTTFPEDKKSEWLLSHALFFLNSTNHLPERSLEDSRGHDQDERLVAESRGADDHPFAVAHSYVAMDSGFGTGN